MKSVAKIDIDAARGPEHGPVSLGEPAVGMAGRILIGQVGLHLCESASTHSASPENLADEILGNLIGWASKKVILQYDALGQRKVVEGEGSDEA